MSTGAQWSASFGAAPISAMQVYDEVFVPRVFEPWARLMASLLELSSGEAVLDVACGPGSASRVAAECVGPDGRVTGCDLSPAMLAIAKAKPPAGGSAEIAYLEAPADHLPVGEGEFDVAMCQQGLQFFPDRAAAVAEMKRVLRPGGRLGIAVWTTIDRSLPFAVLADAIEEVAGPGLAERYRSGPWGFTDPQSLVTLLEQGGFSEIRVAQHALPARFEGGPAQLVATLAASGVAEQLDQLPNEDKERLLQTVARMVGDGPLEAELESNLAMARS